MIAASLGTAFNLPIPDFALAQVPIDLLELSPRAAQALGRGWCFASQARGQVVEYTASSLGRLPRAFQQRLFLFDYWIRNEDRTGTDDGGNPNVFLDLGAGTPVVLDHNLAFDPAYDFTQSRALHICSPAWYQPSVDLFLPATARTDMVAALAAPGALKGELPEIWLDAEPDHFDEAIATLSSCHHDEFWDALR